MGMSIPPTAATHGSDAVCGDESEPQITSCVGSWGGSWVVGLWLERESVVATIVEMYAG